MYERRFDRCIDDLLARVAEDGDSSPIVVTKWAHNEDHPCCELKYDIHFRLAENMDDFIETFESMPVIAEAGIEMEYYDDDTAIIFISWYADDIDERLAFEDDFVEKYSAEYHYFPKGSKEEDSKVLLGDWYSGELGVFAL